MRGYEAAGAQAIQIEDQEFPKKCGHTPGRRVPRLPNAVNRIKVASEARSSRDFLVIARTDARTSLGLDEALRLRPGFPESRRRHSLHRTRPRAKRRWPGSGRTFDVPLLANMVEGGRTPVAGQE